MYVLQRRDGFDIEAWAHSAVRFHLHLEAV
jgi:hypothetical protein